MVPDTSITANIANSTGQVVLGYGMNLSTSTVTVAATCMCSTPITSTPSSANHAPSLPNLLSASPISAMNIHASVNNSSGQVILGSGVNSDSAAVVNPNQTRKDTSTNPCVLKQKTNLIKICQACCKGYEEVYDTLGLVVARSERCLISNMTTGVQFLGKATNSHYHCHLQCLQAVDQNFHGDALQIRIKACLTEYQKLYLITCIKVPLSKLR